MRLWLLSSVAAVSIGAATLAGGASGGEDAHPGTVARPPAKQVTFFDERRETLEAADTAEVVVSDGSAVWQFAGRPLARPTRVVSFPRPPSRAAAAPPRTCGSRSGSTPTPAREPGSGATSRFPAPTSS